jgi:pimeloyl-ACP methyl ester carboxylesterase
VTPREIPLYTLEGVRDAAITTHPFSTADGLGLSLLRFQRAACDDVVMLIHGLTTSTDMFIMPEQPKNLVTSLLDHGFTDVWSLDCRMSNRFSYNLVPHAYTLDTVALFDHPAAIATIRKAVGARRLHVICHCLGSLSFMMSLAARTVTGITSAISNSIALTPRVPPFSRFKLTFMRPLMRYLLGQPYISPGWAADPWMSRGKVIANLVNLAHPECDVAVCHMLSMMWGAGRPALYLHENLHEVTHRRGGDLFGGVGLQYDTHVLKMVRAGHAVKFAPHDPAYRALPDDYWAKAPDIETPILFVTGDQNRVFTASNVVCYRELMARTPAAKHELQVFANYGHQDVFMGKSNDVDTFPRMLAFLDAHRR